MTSVDDVLQHALALPPGDRASLVQSLIHSFPDSPRTYSTAEELAAELNRRLEETAAGRMPTFPIEETMRRAREAVRQVRK